MNKGICKHCQKEFDISDKSKGWMANHSRWCSENPKKDSYNKDLIKARSAKRNFNNQFTYGAIVSEATREKQRVASTGKRHTEKSKLLIKEKALASTHRRLRKGVVEYKGILLDSSWELALAKRLDELNIEWIRPDPLPWIDENGIIHNYFPDFYLPKYNRYIDPKNPHAAKVQDKKLKILLKQYKNIEIIDTLKKCENFTI